ncbi:SDR family oxidoreductase [archaeon]|nr:SDR family oxidoreductase [archaeon]
MKALVTGGMGFIGSHLVDRLLAEGHKVIVIDNLSSGKEENLAQHKDNKKLKFYKRDICSNLSAIFNKDKIDIVYHLAAIINVQQSIHNPTQTHNVNLYGTFNLLNMCKKFGVKRFVFSSSSAVYGEPEKLPMVETMRRNPLSPYALHKVTGEEYCRLFSLLYGLETISLRYFNVYGARQNPEGGYACLIPKFIKMIKNNISPTINGDGEQKRDFVFVSDVVDAIVLAGRTENKDCLNQAFNIGSGNALSVNEITKSIIELSGKKIKPAYCPAVIEPRITLAGISKAKQLLGWEPKKDFKEGLKETFEYFIKS